MAQAPVARRATVWHTLTAEDESAAARAEGAETTVSADFDPRDLDDREPAFSAPVSAHEVRRRTSPENIEPV